MKQSIMEYPAFWRRWGIRLAGEIGLGMMVFSGFVELYGRWPSPFAVLLLALIVALPMEAGLCFSMEGKHLKSGLIAAAAGFAVMYILPFAGVSGWGVLLVMLFLAALAEMLLIVADDILDHSMTPLYVSARRVRDARIYLIGLFSPALAALLLSHATFEAVLRIGGALFGVSLVYSIVVLHQTRQQRIQADTGFGELTQDVLIVSGGMNGVMSMTVGALLVPMLLSRASAGALAAVIVSFFAGLSLGSAFDPLRSFYSDDRKAFSKNAALLLLVQVMLFGMARTGWQWNLLSAAGGVLAASAWGDLAALRVSGQPKLQRVNGIARAAGMLLGACIGTAAEFVVGRSPLIAELCARLTGHGEGSGYAMVFVLAGVAGAFALDMIARRIRRSEAEE